MREHAKYYLLMAIILCIAPALWFPSWSMYIVVASIICLAALPVISVLFMIVWVLTRFMMKGEN